MKYSPGIGKEPNLQKIVLISAVLHLILISFAVIIIRPKEREFRSYYVKLVGPAVSTSKGKGTLPGKKKRTIPPKKIKKKLPAKKVVKTPPKADMSLEQVDRVSKEIERLRAISALSKRKKERESAKEIEVIKKEAHGNGSGGAGIPGDVSSAVSNSYYALITQKIWGQWVYPDTAASGLELIISIKISRNGKIISREIEKSSGNMLFDNSAIKALSKASPLPPPPAEMEIGVRFYL